MTLLTASHGKKIIAGLIADYSNHPVMFDAEASVILSLGAQKLGPDARPDCSGDSIDFLLDVDGKKVLVEHKTTTASLKVLDDTENLFSKVKSSGFQISECGWAGSGKAALETLVFDHFKVSKMTGADHQNTQLLVTIQHETDTTRFVQLYALNFWDILSHCYYSDGRKLRWEGCGSRLVSRRTGATILTFQTGSRTVIKLTRDGMNAFNPTFIGSGQMVRRKMNFWTKNVA